MEPLESLLRQQSRESYRQMMVRLLPNLPPQTIVGVPTPELRRLAGQMEGAGAFLESLPHGCFEENQIHCFLLEKSRDFSWVAEQVERFLPYVDNWATCDQLRPKAFAANHAQLLPYIRRWLDSDHPYTVRFAMGMLMCHFLEEDFDPEYPELVARVYSQEYYVQMMAAWYFATALAKQYETVFPYIAQQRLDKWVHNKAIQKAVESRRITQEQKALLRQYRIK